MKAYAIEALVEGTDTFELVKEFTYPILGWEAAIDVEDVLLFREKSEAVEVVKHYDPEGYMHLGFVELDLEEFMETGSY